MSTHTLPQFNGAVSPTKTTEQTEIPISGARECYQDVEIELAKTVAIDPGPECSALVVWDVPLFSITHTRPIWKFLSELEWWKNGQCVIERVASYGMPVGEEIFKTVYWSGRFAQSFGADNVQRVPRLKVKLHLCHDSRAKDANIDRFGNRAQRKNPASYTASLAICGPRWRLR
jgi:hypothetical protein